FPGTELILDALFARSHSALFKTVTGLSLACAIACTRLLHSSVVKLKINRQSRGRHQRRRRRDGTGMVVARGTTLVGDPQYSDLVPLIRLTAPQKLPRNPPWMLAVCASTTSINLMLRQRHNRLQPPSTIWHSD